MALFTIQIGEVAVLTFGARDLDEARTYAQAPRFRAEIGVLDHADAPLWNGRTRFLTRQASEPERDRWRTSYRRAVRQGEIVPDERGFGLFLVPVTCRPC